MKRFRPGNNGFVKLVLALAVLALALALVADVRAAEWPNRYDESCVASAAPNGEGFNDVGFVGVWGLRTESGTVVFWLAVDWCHGWSGL